MIPNACDAVTNRDVCETAAKLESTVPNAYDAVGNFDACKVVAILERTSPNACDAVGNLYACKTPAISERTAPNACDGKPLVNGRDIHLRRCTRIIGHGILRAVRGQSEYQSFGELRRGRAAHRTDVVHIVVRNGRNIFRVTVAADRASVGRLAHLLTRRLLGHFTHVYMLSHRNIFRITVPAARASVGHLAHLLTRRLLGHFTRVCMPRHRNYFLFNEHGAADGAMTAFRQTRFRAGGCPIGRHLFIVLYGKCDPRILVKIAGNNLDAYGDLFPIGRRNGQYAILGQCDAVIPAL